MKDPKLGVVFALKSEVTGKKIDHWPRVAKVAEGQLASCYPEIKVSCR